ncbi:MAG: hypothetical protein C3F11_01895 [Methylocystaceae bacterium]|nr:MAG: hypothetical protein C3F11_01895 [Methylocystaceae bacterium]
MEDASQIAIFVAVGALVGAAFVFLARWSARWPQFGARRALAYALIATAALYVGLAFRSDRIGAWLGIELTGFAVYASFALLGIVGSPWWLVAGFALHPFWHLQFHYVGTGSAFTPEWFTLGLTGFDVIAAAYVAYAILRDADPSLRRRQPAAPEEPKLSRAARRAAKKLR